jgi:molecular chaperone DnaJ
MPADYYETLGVARDATAADLKKAYRRQAMKFHPDRNPGDDAAQDRFKEAQKAYEVLKDERKRAAYDRFGHEGVNGVGGGGPGGAAGFGDINDIFGDMFGDIFGGGRRRQRQRSHRGQDLRYTMELDLEEAVHGTNKEIRIPTVGQCGTCNGSGSKSGRLEVCSTCGGQGQVRMQQGIFSVQQTCPACGGSGRSIADPCDDCHGSGQVRETRTLQVKIPPGVDEGDRIRLSGEGGAGAQGGTAGDLYVDVHVRPHPLFQREGDDLFCEVPITITTAALGGQMKVPTLEGSVMLKIPPETQSGKLFRLRGKGVKSVRSRSEGDLLCRVAVETPVKLTREQKDLLKKFQESFSEEGGHNPQSSGWTDKVRSFFDRMGL